MSDVYRSSRGDRGNHQPGDLFFEYFAKNGNGTTPVTPTLGTDTTIVGNVLWMYPVSNDASPAAISVEVLGTSPQFEGESAKAHDVFVIGGRLIDDTSVQSELPRIFRLPSIGTNPRPNSNEVIWEFVRLTMSGAGSKKFTYDSDLSYIKRAHWVIPTQIISAAPDAGGCAVSEITSIDATVLCGSGSEIVEVLVGGYIEGGTIADTESLPGQSIPARLDSGTRPLAPGDLIGEVITKTLASASPSTVTITAADDCEVIKQIMHVIPVSKAAAKQAIGWSGTKGATSIIYGPNTVTDDVTCLVLGR